MRLDAVWTVFVLLSSAAACGPGRGSGRRRSISKLTPLVFKQHVPNVSENTLGASGLPEGRISRTDPRFKNLVPVYSEDIIFKDEEGTGADRFMTQRCMEKLNALAISVMNQWPGVKLRVIEGWEEEAIYHSDNLHYEGRAVDITTSDKDRSKYGMLARLAVEAGFDWVYYEARAYIHCSVKSESSQVGKSGGCFSGNSTVTLEGGLTRRLADVQVGQRVLSYDTTSGQLAFSEILMFLDRDPQSRRQFLQLTTVGGWSLTVTPQHLMMRKRDLGGNRTSEEWETVFAARLSPRDKLLVNENGVLVERRLETSRLVLDLGIYAPLTDSGTVVVDGVVASCYAVLGSQSISHAVFSPVRLYKKVVHGFERAFTFLKSSSPSNSTSIASDSQSPGIHWYPKLLYALSNHLIPDSLLYK